MTANEKQATDFSGIARLLGRRGGLARAKRMTPEKKSESAEHAAKIRWTREKNGALLRSRLKQELISAAKKKTAGVRLAAYFNLSRDIALLSLSGKNNRSLKIAR
ncbi:MAG: hypothetical protein ABII20_00745 [Candidatus Omnitrophota bacterium]|nr:hypothetical protein [Candidatus Omnitrophota bacterium]MBU2529139.1 hypothetical protein [bacterium]MBU3929486.1 hypothetical protein [bacterium]MBU4122817.1 hypothetical protein [bacterium]